MKTTNKKSSRIGLVSVVLSILMIVVVVFVNVIVGALPATSTKFDTSNYGFFDFSDETAELVSAVEKPVTLTLVCQNGKEDKQIKMLTEKYAALCPNVEYATVDPVLHPMYETETGETVTLSEYPENSIIVESADKYKVVSYEEIFTTDYSEEEMYYYYMYTGQMPENKQYFNGEVALTSAVEYVTSEELPTVYFLSGHGEIELGKKYGEYLDNDNYTILSLSLQTEEAIPENADALVINVPTSDLSEKELSLIEGYIDNGGKVLMLSTFHEKLAGLENVQALAQYMGIEIIDGVIVEANTSNYFGNYPFVLSPDIQSHEITKSLMKRKLEMPIANGVKAAGEAPEGVTVTNILETSSSAYVTDGKDYSEENAIYSGAMPVGVLSAKGEGTLVWYSSYGVTDENCDSDVSGANSELFINTLNYLCEKEASVSVTAKAMSSESLTLSERTSTVWGVILCAVVPLTVAAIGISVWIVRKKR